MREQWEIIDQRGQELDSWQVESIIKANQAAFNWTPAMTYTDLALKHSYYILGIISNQVMGFIAYHQLDDEGEIIQVYVRPEIRGQGMGTALLRYLQKKSHLKRIYLEVRVSNHPAIALYQKHDFKIIHTRRAYYHQPIEDGLMMEWRKEDKDDTSTFN